MVNNSRAKSSLIWTRMSRLSPSQASASEKSCGRLVYIPMAPRRGIALASGMPLAGLLGCLVEQLCGQRIVGIELIGFLKGLAGERILLPGHVQASQYEMRVGIFGLAQDG